MILLDEIDIRLGLMKARARRARSAKGAAELYHRRLALRELAELAEALLRYITQEVSL